MSRCRTSLLVSLLVAIAVTTATDAARAQPTQGLPLGDPHALVWNDRWTRFQPYEYVGTAVIGGSAIALFAWGKPAQEAHWDGPILFDKPIRDAFRVEGAGALRDVRLVGDAFTIAPIVYAYADAFLTPVVRGKPDIAWQLSMMNLEAHAITGLFLATMFETVGRARPSHRECVAGTTDEPLCRTGTFASFPSGHAGGAFTAAGLTCAHHLHVPLYGGGVPDALACAASLTLATGSAMFRLIGDRHYASDVLVGGGIGFLVGYGLPTLLHYRERPLGQVYASQTTRAAITIGAANTPAGMSVLGTF